MKALLLSLIFATATTVQAQTRVTLPSGTVFLVRTDAALQSADAQVGQTFTTTVIEDVSVNGYTVIPANSQVRGVVSYVQPSTRQQSGVMQVRFDRLMLANGASYAMAGKLTSTDSVERRQIDARADSRVVLIGERGGLGAAIAGAGSSRGSASGILAALGNMLSEGTDVSVAAGTTFAVQLEQSLTLSVRGNANMSDEATIFTAVDRIRAAQQALARRSYYRGTATGVLDNATRRALFEFQLDNNITATGNLDGRTASALGIMAAAGMGASSNGNVLSVRDAAILRRAAQALTTRQRQAMSTQEDLDLLFAFSAFADNASLYEEFIRTDSTSDRPTQASHALVTAARRVDDAMNNARPATTVRNLWDSIRRQLSALDPNYR